MIKFAGQRQNGSMQDEQKKNDVLNIDDWGGVAQ